MGKSGEFGASLSGAGQLRIFGFRLRSPASKAMPMTKRKAITAIGLIITTTWIVGAIAPANAEESQQVIEGVRTTAYSGSVADNGPYDAKDALGKHLQEGDVASAAADWSRYPVGTRFRVVETGQEYVIDDYGSALVGTGTIDLYKRTDAQVNRWGVRRVTIEILEWGSSERSLEILRERGHMKHIRQMVRALQDQDSA